jgi:hypothetical protein
MFRKIERALPLINCIIASSGLVLQLYPRVYVPLEKDHSKNVVKMG